MDTRNKSKINKLIELHKRGTICTQKWLYSLDISRYLAEQYCFSGWLKRVGYGAYVVTGDDVSWLGELDTLINQLVYKIHLASKTALDLQQFQQHLNFGDNAIIWLNKHPQESRVLPKWFLQRFSNLKLHYFARDLFPKAPDLGIIEISLEAKRLFISTPERAILEYLDSVPQEFSLEQAQFIMESMTTLRPDLLNQLLEQCSSKKVKRLFMLLAEHENHQWLKDIKKDQINFGSGKMQIGSGGYYHSNYLLSLPTNLNKQEGYSSNA